MIPVSHPRQKSNIINPGGEVSDVFEVLQEIEGGFRGQIRWDLGNQAKLSPNGMDFRS